MIGAHLLFLNIHLKKTAFMKRISSLLVLILLSSTFLHAEKIIGDLDFTKGDWAMVGVPLHNYKKLPIQEELSTFISKDISLMQEIQQGWDLEMTFDDKCDYHYALKFYNGRELVRTITLNLYCGYATYDGLSYDFNPKEFERLKTGSSKIPWSRISFSDVGLMKKAIDMLNDTEGVYWYEDVEQYKFSGSFMLTIGDMSWNTDLDSLKTAVGKRVYDLGRSREFHVQEYYHQIINGKLKVRYIVSCEESLAKRLEIRSGVYLPWRSHMHNKDKVSILAIGIDESKYWRLMNRY